MLVEKIFEKTSKEIAETKIVLRTVQCNSYFLLPIYGNSLKSLVIGWKLASRSDEETVERWVKICSIICLCMCCHKHKILIIFVSANIQYCSSCLLIM